MLGVLSVQMFSLEDWKKHRSGSRYSHHVTTLLE